MKSQDKFDKYQDFLDATHAKNVTPEELINEVVMEGTGQTITSKKRIVAGEVNEVYNITLSNNQAIILRISRNFPDFEQERWAIEKCKVVEIPVPTIIFIKHVEDQKLSFCAQKKVSGTALERGEIDFKSLSESTRKKYINQAGEVLSKIHSIKTTGFGWINGKGEAEFETAYPIFDHFRKNVDSTTELLIKNGVKKESVQKAFKILENYKEIYAKRSPVLNHGDFGDKHIMVENERITGIIDWGSIRSDIPEYDFANWEYWFGKHISTSWLKEGYQNKDIFTKEFDELMHVIMLYKGIENIDWYTEQRYKEMVERCVKKFNTTLNFFR